MQIILLEINSFTCVCSIVAYAMPMSAIAILELFLAIYYGVETALARTGVWLVYKLFCVGVVNIWSKMTCYAMRDDFQSLLLVFTLVIVFLLSAFIPT